jgi:hypothetical protein
MHVTPAQVTHPLIVQRCGTERIQTRAFLGHAPWCSGAAVRLDAHTTPPLATSPTRTSTASIRRTFPSRMIDLLTDASPSSTFQATRAACTSPHSLPT